MDILWIVVVAWIAMGILGSWVATEKDRGGTEGFLLGAMFGPFGVLVEALLPNGSVTTKRHGEEKSGGILSNPSTQGVLQGVKKPGSPARGIDEKGQIAYLLTRYREILDEVKPNWRQLPYHRKKGIIGRFDKQLMRELKLTPSQFKDLSIEAKRSILNP